MKRWGWSDKTYIKVFLNEFLENLLFGYQKRIYKSNQRLSTFFQADIEIIRTMRSEDFSFGFIKDISKFIILRRSIWKVRSVRSLTVDFILFFLFIFILLYFSFSFNFLFLEQLGLGVISHAVTSVTTWWHSHETDHGKSRRN